MSYEYNIARGLDTAWQRAERRAIDLQTARYIIFSDHHKGKRDGADDFEVSETAYNAALGYYLEAGYTLLVLGDVEELWECRPRDVLAAYPETLALEAAFHRDGRYLRFFGNHDDEWESPTAVRRHLRRLLGDVTVLEGLRFEALEEQDTLADIFFVHGHQGTAASDKLRFISKPFVRYVWRPIQRLTRWRMATPARSFALRAKHDRALHAWAASRRGVVLIAGHTHRPVFLAEPRAPIVADELAQLKRRGGGREKIAETRAELEWLGTVERSGVDAATPCYFNTGCCCFSDGDCTGIEIADGQIRLVRWPDDAGNPRKKVLRTADLRMVLTSCAQRVAR